VAAGATRECVVAETQLRVCEWRLKSLICEQKQSSLSPPAQFGATLTAIRQRALLCGGLQSDKVLVLELENELEKQRRLQEEFYAKLDKDK
jgi:hypothetical protein